jgi:hypothetical protein
MIDALPTKGKATGRRKTRTDLSQVASRKSLIYTNENVDEHLPRGPNKRMKNVLNYLSSNRCLKHI